MRDGSWTGAILGRLNLVVRASQMVKLVLRRRLLRCSSWRHLVSIHTPRTTIHVLVTAKLMTFHFRIGCYPPCCQVTATDLPPSWYSLSYWRHHSAPLIWTDLGVIATVWLTLTMFRRLQTDLSSSEGAVCVWAGFGPALSCKDSWRSFSSDFITTFSTFSIDLLSDMVRKTKY